MQFNWIYRRLVIKHCLLESHYIIATVSWCPHYRCVISRSFSSQTKSPFSFGIPLAMFDCRQVPFLYLPWTLECTPLKTWLAQSCSLKNPRSKASLPCSRLCAVIDLPETEVPQKNRRPIPIFQSKATGVYPMFRNTHIGFFVIYPSNSWCWLVWADSTILYSIWNVSNRLRSLDTLLCIRLVDVWYWGKGYIKGNIKTAQKKGAAGQNKAIFGVDVPLNFAVR